MLAVVFFASLLALALGLAWMTRRQQLGLKRLGWGLKRLHRGQFEFRLETDRRDEFASVFGQFNRLAVRLDELNRRTRRRSESNAETDGPALRIPPDTMIEETLDLENAAPEKTEDESDTEAGQTAKVTPLRRQ